MSKRSFGHNPLTQGVSKQTVVIFLFLFSMFAFVSALDYEDEKKYEQYWCQKVLDGDWGASIEDYKYCKELAKND